MFIQGFIMEARKKLCGFPQSFCSCHMLDRAGNFTGTQAPGTNIHMARRTINQSLHALDIGLPGTIGTTMRVGNLDTKGHALIAELALSHPLHLLAVVTSCLVVSQAVVIIPEVAAKCKHYLTKNRKNFQRGKLRNATEYGIILLIYFR